MTQTPIKPITVTKRNGNTEPLDITRIREVIQTCCADLNVEPVALESGLTAELRDGVTTREIQENLINCALTMTSTEEPDWRYVAGRLHIWSLWKDTEVARGYEYSTCDNTGVQSSYQRWVQDCLKCGQYDDRLRIYSPDELKEAGGWIDPSLDLDYDYAGAVLLTKRYLLPNELPQEALLTCALLIASVEPSPVQRMVWGKRIYHAIARRKISLATPILANLRVPGGSLASCFITAMEDNLESIFHEITNTARISKGGGGVGMNVSRIRATGSRVMGKDNASGGVLPWAKLLNDTAIAVNQGGRRAGAVTVSLDIWHLDIPEFLECQTEAGDQRRKSYDIFTQLVIVDEFMRRVRDDLPWTLCDPYEVRTVLGVELAELWGRDFDAAYSIVEEAAADGRLKLTHRLRARDIFKQAMRTQVETGLPYMAFKDTINRANPNKHEGYIPGANLCTESWSNVTPGKYAHTCNLVSLNLANINDDLPVHCETAVRILDNTIELTQAPFKESAAHNDRYRTIGVGAMGLADWLASRQMRYTHLRDIAGLFEDIAYHCTRYSVQLAKERGAYPAHAGSEWSQGKLMNARTLEDVTATSIDPERWVKLHREIQTHGIRNSHITAIAPNTSSSLVQGCTASVLPTFSRFYYDKWAKGVVPIAPPFIGSHFWHYQESQHLDQRIIVDAVATMQRWIDTGISMELMFNLNEDAYGFNQTIKARDIFDTLLYAWERGCKAVYYIRTVQKDNYKEGGNECASCAN